jgi:phosphatidylglycerol:prolipoprotein diacylglycerol transferase
MITYPNIDPVLVSIGPLTIRWYGVAYLIGILTAMVYLRSVLAYALGLSRDQQTSLMTTVLIGIILGGRIGYILFYDIIYFWHNPFQIIAIWNGGMSYHGGGIGAMVALFVFSSVHHVSFKKLLDCLAIGATFGVFFGRMANFINGELYGRITDVSWAMVFPAGGPLPRHPSQLYEAFFEGVVVFVILRVILKYIDLKPGQLFGIYWLCYATFRFVIEFFREPDHHIGLLWGGLSMGQILCLVMGIGGVVMYHWFGKLDQKKNQKKERV